MKNTNRKRSAEGERKHREGKETKMRRRKEGKQEGKEVGRGKREVRSET